MLAYLDSFAGLVPCKPLAWHDTQYGPAEVQVRVTATRGGYKRGDVLWFTARRVIPRSCIRRRKYSTWIVCDPVASAELIDSIPRVDTAFEAWLARP